MGQLKKVEIYTDGACSGNPGVGGWGAVLKYKDAEKEISGRDEMTTNNKMELTAAIRALELLKGKCEVVIYSDSKYVVKGMIEWLFNWKKNNWKNSNKKDVLNRDLWEQLDELNQKHKITWTWIKGHADNEYNNRCDELARNEIEKKYRNE